MGTAMTWSCTRPKTPTVAVTQSGLHGGAETPGPQRLRPTSAPAQKLRGAGPRARACRGSACGTDRAFEQARLPEVPMRTAAVMTREVVVVSPNVTLSAADLMMRR